MSTTLASISLSHKTDKKLRNNDKDIKKKVRKPRSTTDLKAFVMLCLIAAKRNNN